MKKVVKFICFLGVVIIINFMTLMAFNYSKKVNIDNLILEATELEEESIIDDTIYDKLEIFNLYAKSSSSNDVDKISWYLKDDIYYLFLPNQIDRNNVFIEFTTSTNTYLSVYDNNNTFIKNIVSGGFVPLNNEDYVFKLETNVNKPTIYRVKVLNSKLPSLHINLEGGKSSFKNIIFDKKHNTSYPGIAVIANNNEKQEAIVKKFKGRGNATWVRNKKPFLIKFDKKVSVLGMEEAKSWVLLANYFDGTMARNKIWLDFAQDIKMDASVNSTPIELYVNNEFQGNYLLTSKVEVKETRIDITDKDYLFEVDQHIGNYDFKLKNGYPVTIHNPDLEKCTAQERKYYINDAKKYLNKIETMLYGKTSFEELSKYIDMESFAKYYLVNDISLNFDSFRNSFYMYVKDGLLHAGPVWDMDATSRRSYSYASSKGYYTLDNYALNNVRSVENWSRALMKRNKFSSLVDKYYFEYNDIINSLPNKIDEYKSLIDESAKMNYIYWPYSKMIDNQWDKEWLKGNYDYESSMKMFKKEVNIRLNWYKKEYANLKYTDLSYKGYNDKGELIEENIISSKDINFISKEIKKLEIYANDNKKEELIYKVSVNEEIYLDVEFSLKRKILTKRKNYNSYTYNIVFVRI